MGLIEDDIVQSPDPRLFVPARRLEDDDWMTLPELVFSMRTAMGRYKGVGVSANQVGSPLAVFLVGQKTVVNPEVMHIHGTEKQWEERKEGCLSIDHGETRHFRRAAPMITLSYQNVMGAKKTQLFKGFDARIVQHELRHLNGQLIDGF